MTNNRHATPAVNTATARISAGPRANARRSTPGIVALPAARGLSRIKVRHRRRQLPRTLIARAPTTTIVTSEIELSSIIIIFARGVSGTTSVGLNAVAVENAANR